MERFPAKKEHFRLKITSDAAQSGSSYLIYKGVEQTFKISTSRVHNGSSMDDTIMENRDSIKIKIESTLKLTEAGKEQFAKLGPAQIYHQFDISLKKYLQEISGGEYDVIGTEDASYTYTLTGNGLDVKEEGKFQNVAGLDTLTIQHGGSDLKKALEKAENDETAVTVAAEITLTYTSSDHFPERDTSNNSDNSGISVIAVSRIANTANQLPITTNKRTQEDRSRYYTANPSKASLTYSSIDRTGIGDTTQQLGINQYYDKILDLASGSTAEAGKTLLPSGTRLTLVDRQTMQYYTYKTTGTEDLHKFDFAQMTTADGQTAFRPVYICDLLDMTVSDPVTEEAEGTTYYVIENDPAKATVRVGTTYYRRAEENDKDASKYRITITEASKSEARSEGYYLSVQVPETAGYSVINNRLNYGAISRKEGTLPAKIKSDEKKSGSGYVVYNGVEQKFTVSTTRVHNGNIMGDTAMEDSDSIKINLESKLKLTEAGKDRFNKLGPSEVHHQFTINLKKYLQGKAEEYDVIGTEIVKYIYTFKNADGTWTHTETGTISDAAGKDILSLQYGSSDLKKKLEKATNDANAITVTAEITLTYAGADKFPVRNTADTNDNSGICVIGVSRIANTQTQLPITENKRTENDKNRYYSTNPSKAKLTYSAVDQTAMGDTTQQLGINPSDTVNPADIIYTKADYDYSNVDETILDKAKSISYKMELFQKNDSGSYDETKPLPIEDYLQNTVKENGSTEASPAGSSETSGTSTVYQWEESFKSDDGRHQIARFRYAPFTGEAFERKNYTYANYRVRLTVVLLDDKGNELDGTKATDYIIYTNARISQEIMQQQQ